MARLKIKDAPLLPVINGDERIPTGGKGDFTVTPDMLAEHFKSNSGFATDAELTVIDNKLKSHTDNKNNPHQTTKEQVGLGSVDNTSDIDKPVSNATSIALDTKADKAQVINDLNLKADKSNTYTKIETNDLLGLKADKSSTYSKLETDNLLVPITEGVSDLEFAGGLKQYDRRYGFDSDYVVKIGGYPLYAELRLTNGDIVKSTIANNTNNPNVDMTGWINPNASKLNIRSYGAKGSFDVTTRTGEPETSYFKKYVSDQQSNAWSSIDLAADIYDYLIDETLVFDKTVTIFGGSGSTYNQPEQPKKGSIVLADGLNLGFDFGANRPIPPLNFADMWCVKDLMVQPQTMKSKTQTAFAITGANDAPDRGINFVGVSAMGFDKCVYLPDHGTLTQGATMNFDGCVMSHNANVIVADNCVYGLRVVNNQMEANTASVIKGKFNAAVTIEDNMLEGNVNCIDLQSGTRVAFQSQVTIGANYFEWNKGDFVARIQGVYAWDDLYPTVVINPNFAYEIDALDYMIFKDRLHVQYNDVTHVATMANGFDGVYGSYLTNSHKNKIKARKGSDGKFSSSIAQNPSDISSLREPIGFSTVTAERTDKSYINLNGESYTYLNEYDEFHPVSGTFNAGDVVEIHAIFCDVGRMRANGTEEIRTHFGFGGYFDGGVKAFEVNSVGVTKSNGDVAVVSGICTVETTITNPIFRWYCLENDNLSGKFLGFAYKNHGAIADDTLLITPFVPTLIPYNTNRYKSVQVMTIPANSSSYVTASISGAKYGDMVETSITPVDNPSHVVSSNGYVNDSNEVVIRVFNHSDVAITSAQFWINAEVKK